MDYKSIIEILGVAFGMLFGDYLIVRIALKLERKRSDEYKDLAQQYKQHSEGMDHLLRYCISDIYNRAIENEDYEEAQRCHDIIQKLNKS